MNNFKELRVWQVTMDLAYSIYHLTKSFPKDEQFGLTRQIRDAACSVPSNISEGFARGSRNEFSHFLAIAQGSLAEVETQLTLANRLQYLEQELFVSTTEEIESAAKQLRALRTSIQKLNGKPDARYQAPSTKHQAP